MIKKLLLIVAAAHWMSSASAEPLTTDRSGTLPLSTNPLSNGGTLPLHIGGGGGTLPLKLSGMATAIAGQPAQLAADVLITSTDPNPGTASPGCQMAGPNVTTHAAQGTVSLSGAPYGITGICYDHASGQMEIVSQGASSRSTMAALLPSSEPRALSGRLVVASGAQTSHYNFSVQAP